MNELPHRKYHPMNDEKIWLVQVRSFIVAKKDGTLDGRQKK